MLPYLFAGFTLINIIYFGYFFRFWFFYKESTLQTFQKSETGVTIISCAQNEAENLPQLIDALTRQNYPVFEIILINDHSTDGSLKLLEHSASRYKNLSVIDLKTERGKKAGITKAVS